MPNDAAGFLYWVEPVAAIVTAAGTLVLGAFTVVLARETKRLADVGEQPNIVATFRPNRHTLLYLDMEVENTGTAVAYDIRIAIVPELDFGSDARHKGVPLQRISVLKSKQSISSHFAKWSDLQPKAFTVTTSWLRSPNAIAREEISYSVDLSQMATISHLGTDPEIEVANATKKMAEAIDRIARGNNRIAVDAFTSSDRSREREELDRFYDEACTPRDPAAESASAGAAPRDNPGG